MLTYPRPRQPATSHHDAEATPKPNPKQRQADGDSGSQRAQVPKPARKTSTSLQVSQGVPFLSSPNLGNLGPGQWIRARGRRDRNSNRRDRASIRQIESSFLFLRAPCLGVKGFRQVGSHAPRRDLTDLIGAWLEDHRPWARFIPVLLSPLAAQRPKGRLDLWFSGLAEGLRTRVSGCELVSWWQSVCPTQASVD